MNLSIPIEFRQQINPYSGYLNPQYPYSHKTLKGLYLSPENIRYLSVELYKLITDEQYVQQYIPDHYNVKVMAQRMIQVFSHKKEYIMDMTYRFMLSHQIEFIEFRENQNPILNLHHINREFLLETSRLIIEAPNHIIPEWYDINPDTGELDSPMQDINLQYGYTASSWADGQWHPEDLFLNSSRNREGSYWQDLEVNLHADPNAKGLNHKWNMDYFNEGTVDRFKNKGEKITSFGQFPIWQWSVNKRNYDRDNSEGLRAGGLSDRRVQVTTKYDMHKLRKFPSAPKQYPDVSKKYQQPYRF